MRPLLAAGLYVLLLLPALVAPIGRVHARAYLMEFAYRGGGHFATDVLLNVALFVPLGWLLHRAARRYGIAGRTGLFLVVAACAGFSLSIETLQYFLATRYSSIVDVAMNAVGAWAGRGRRRGSAPARAMPLRPPSRGSAVGACRRIGLRTLTRPPVDRLASHAWLRQPPSVVVLAGPNGAGKSTMAARLVVGPVRVSEFVDADVLARGMPPLEEVSRRRGGACRAPPSR